MHAPNFDFWTGCREIKRCEESKRTLKNPFASHLAEFNTTLKLLKITDQWYIVPVKFRFGQNRDLLVSFLLPLAGGPKDGKCFNLMPLEGLFLLLASIQAQIIVKGMRRNETATIRASDISTGRGPAKFRYFREIPRNSQKNTKYREICQKYFQIHVGKTYLILILAIRPVLFTPNVQIYLETSSLQRPNNLSKLPGVLRWTLRKTGH